MGIGPELGSKTSRATGGEGQDEKRGENRKLGGSLLKKLKEAVSNIERHTGEKNLKEGYGEEGRHQNPHASHEIRPGRSLKNEVSNEMEKAEMG